MSKSNPTTPEYKAKRPVIPIEVCHLCLDCAEDGCRPGTADYCKQCTDFTLFLDACLVQERNKVLDEALRIAESSRNEHEIRDALAALKQKNEAQDE